MLRIHVAMSLGDALIAKEFPLMAVFAMPRDTLMICRRRCRVTVPRTVVQ
jgi:hypothetical protein